MGVDTKNALEMLVADFNAAGGITVKGQKYHVELIVYDDKWSAEAGRAAVERLVHDDKVKFIISVISSATILSGAALFEQEKVLNIFGGSTLKALDPKLHYSFGGYDGAHEYASRLDGGGAGLAEGENGRVPGAKR